MMFIPLPTIEPRESHALWYTSSQPTRHPASNTRSSHNAATAARRSTPAANPRLVTSCSDSLAALMLEERALRFRKQNIASFGFSWIRPAGYPKTMMGIREEEMERDEGGNGAADAGMGFIPGDGMVDDEEDVDDGEGQEELERDLDGEIPDAEEMQSGEGSEEEEEGDDGRGLVESGEDEFREDEDEEGFMERDLDGDIPDAFGDEYDDEDGVEHEERDLDEDVPSASDGMDFGAYDDEDDESEVEEEEEEEGQEEEPSVLNEEEIQEDSMMARNLDSDVPSVIEGEQQEWEHTDTDDDSEDISMNMSMNMSMTMDVDPSRQSLPHHNTNLRSSLAGLPEPIPILPQPRQETEAERIFLERWSGGGSFASSDMMPEPSLRIPRRRTRRYSVQSDSETSIL